MIFIWANFITGMAKTFLPNVSLKRLQDMHKKENDPKAEKRLMACILRKKGMTMQDIAGDIGVSYGTIHNWLGRIEEGGLRMRYDIKNKGADCKLTRRQIGKLVRDMKRGPGKLGYESGPWTMPLLRRHIKEAFGVDYHVYSVWELARRLGFRCVVPRTRNYKAASPEEAEAFKKKAHRRVAYWTGRGYTVLAMDEAYSMLENTPRRGGGTGRSGPSCTSGARGGRGAALPSSAP